VTIQGTFQFLARDILGGDSHSPKDDLESFFWLFVWTSLRRVKCGWTSNVLRTIFENSWNAQSARKRKITWLEDITDEKYVDAKENKPFMQQLACLFLEPDVDHTRMLRLFEDALDGARLLSPQYRS